MNSYMWDHYKKVQNKIKIVKHLRDRETALLTPDFTEQGFKSHRDVRVDSVKGFDFMLVWAGLNDDHRPVNIYHSLAVYKEGVPFGWKMEDRKINKEKWYKQMHRKMIAYDFVVDIDAPSHDEIDFAKEDAIKVYETLEPYNPSIRFSGKGFHIYIKYEDMCKIRGLGIRACSFHPSHENSIYFAYYSYAKAIHDTITEFIDLTIYDSRRLIKCPNTLAFYDHDEVYLCREISLEELKNFKLEDYKIKRLVQNGKETKNSPRRYESVEGEFNHSSRQ